MDDLDLEIDRLMAGDPALSILRHFKAGHLPPHLRAVSEVVGKAAVTLARELPLLPDVDERAVALRKLLEGKDAAVRAAVV